VITRNHRVKEHPFLFWYGEGDARFVRAGHPKRAGRRPRAAEGQVPEPERVADMIVADAAGPFRQRDPKVAVRPGNHLIRVGGNFHLPGIESNGFAWKPQGFLA